MNWEVVATAAEVIAAGGVIASLLYVARQVKAAQETAADTNRLTRATGVRDMFQTLATDIELGSAISKTYGFDEYYERMASHLGVSIEDAMRSDFVNGYWFWLHWGQYASTKDAKDLEEMRHVLHSYTTPSLKYSWENSPWAKPSLDPEFVKHVEEVLSSYEDDFYFPR